MKQNGEIFPMDGKLHHRNITFLRLNTKIYWRAICFYVIMGIVFLMFFAMLPDKRAYEYNLPRNIIHRGLNFSRSAVPHVWNVRNHAHGGGKIEMVDLLWYTFFLVLCNVEMCISEVISAEEIVTRSVFCM